MFSANMTDFLNKYELHKSCKYYITNTANPHLKPPLKNAGSRDLYLCKYEAGSFCM